MCSCSIQNLFYVVPLCLRSVKVNAFKAGTPIESIIADARHGETVTVEIAVTEECLTAY